MSNFGTIGTLAVFFTVPIVFFILILAVAKRYKKVGPNQVMVISGRKHSVETAKGGEPDVTGFRIRKGGGAFIFPLLERVDILSLEVMTLDFTTPEVYTKPGVPIVVDGVAQVKIRGDESSIRTAAEQFLGKTVEEIKMIALQTVEGHLRGIIGTLSVEEIYRNRDQFASSVLHGRPHDVQADRGTCRPMRRCHAFRGL
jgi:flotillin